MDKDAKTYIIFFAVISGLALVAFVWATVAFGSGLPTICSNDDMTWVVPVGGRHACKNPSVRLKYIISVNDNVEETK